jgi:hypothetical protein
MPIQRIKRKIEDLRQQPEPVRLRAVSIMTAVSGLVLVVLWAGVLLPVQLAFTRDNQADLPERELFNQVADSVPTLRQNLESGSESGQVGGVRVTNPTPTAPIFNLAPSPSSTPLPSPTDFESAPVQITE